MIGPPCVSVDDAVAADHPAWLARAADRSGLVRGFLIHRSARSVERVALLTNEPGTLTALWLGALRGGGRRLILLEFLGRPRHRRRVLRIAAHVRRRILEGPALRRAMLVGHVLTDWERTAYANAYRVPPERFRVVRWPLSRTGEMRRDEAPGGGRKVVASGRAYCDWDTVLAAAQGRDWDLTLICSRADLQQLTRRAGSVGARVLCELPREEHDDLVRGAAIYVLALRDMGVSAGQVRLMAAVDAGTAVVATRVEALTGYVEESTAVLVPPSDPLALGDAVDALLEDPAERRRLSDRAFARARRWSYSEYFAAIKGLLEEGPADRPGEPSAQ